MNTFEKIKQYIEKLNNELIELNIIVQNADVKDQEQKSFDIKFINREKKIAEREAQVLIDTHLVEAIRKENEKNNIDLQIKQDKLQAEWQKMVEEKEKLDHNKEEEAKERLRLEVKDKIINDKEIEINERLEKVQEKESILKKKYKALSELNRKLNLKRKKTEEKAQKIDDLYSSIE